MDSLCGAGAVVCWAGGATCDREKEHGFTTGRRSRGPPVGKTSRARPTGGGQALQRGGADEARVLSQLLEPG